MISLCCICQCEFIFVHRPLESVCVCTGCECILQSERPWDEDEGGDSSSEYHLPPDSIGEDFGRCYTAHAFYQHFSDQNVSILHALENVKIPWTVNLTIPVFLFPFIWPFLRRNPGFCLLEQGHTWTGFHCAKKSTELCPSTQKEKRTKALFI